MKTTYINAESNTEHVAVSNTFQTIANIANSLLIHNTVKEGVIVPEHKYGYITSLDDETDPDGLRIMKSVNGTIDILFVSLISKKTNVKKVFYANGDKDANGRPIVYFNPTSEVWQAIHNTKDKTAKIKLVCGLIASMGLEIIRLANGVPSRNASTSLVNGCFSDDLARIGVAFKDRKGVAEPELNDVRIDGNRSKGSLLAVLDENDETSKKIQNAVLEFLKLLPYTEPQGSKTSKSKQVYCPTLVDNELCMSYKFFPKVSADKEVEKLKEINELIACKKHTKATLTTNDPTKK